MVRIIRVECLLYVLFFGSSSGPSTGPPNVIQRPRAKKAKCSLEEQNLTNKVEVRNSKVTGKAEVELITSISVNTAQ